MNGFTGGFTFVRAMIAYCSHAVSKEVDARDLKQDVAEHVERYLFVTQVGSGIPFIRRKDGWSFTNYAPCRSDDISSES